MEQAIIVFLILFVVGLIVTGFFVLKRKPEKQSEALTILQPQMLMLQQQINHISQILDSKLSESTKAIQLQFGQSAKIIQDVTEKLTRLDETNRQVVGFADQLQNLQDILKNPKQRGILGEYYLETVLKNVLPPGSYQMQYSFKDGSIVDAVVFANKRLIPIDSKFSLENYNRVIEARNPEEKRKYELAFVGDLKSRIEETAKYVKPEENTMDFTFMFIPSEAVYYDLLINKVGAITEDTNNLIYYAGKKKVIIVSPTSFLAYLQTVLQGLRNQKISEEAKEIIKQVERLRSHLWAYSEYMKKLGGHLGTTVSAYNKASKEFSKVDKDVVKIAGGDEKLKIEEVEPPFLEE
ncbi:MAG: DNA recombination protein RmuC [Candidatus Nealsonbacteria bacterium CG08_land_8_20_14_0_20_38_20]|uniref:DNA recombination protein RmuC n=1 Tax=Candidatus Nealsonbacteria bacterium CG08_land_8_20_14_0_20_38_20 TaxID=1974705 RepID=A0A2H0YNY6_9BACT|nr:MAG: DNA recombination protein RmuC [Candidatus Nealsonbacteria bacterium CG08_land_8_20_14_0_20_38_20]